MSLLEPSPPPSRLPVLVMVAVALLLVWTPVSLAVVTSTSWPRLARYGAPAWLLLAVRMLVTGLGIVAARWILDRDARGLAAASRCLLASSAIAIAVGLTPYFPSNAVPGTKWPTIAVVVLVNLALAWDLTRRDQHGRRVAKEQASSQGQPGDGHCSDARGGR